MAIILDRRNILRFLRSYTWYLKKDRVSREGCMGCEMQIHILLLCIPVDFHLQYRGKYIAYTCQRAKALNHKLDNEFSVDSDTNT